MNRPSALHSAEFEFAAISVSRTGVAVAFADFEQPNAVTRLVRLHVRGAQGVGDVLSVGGNLGLRDAVQANQSCTLKGRRRIRRCARRVAGAASAGIAARAARIARAAINPSARMANPSLLVPA